MSGLEPWVLVGTLLLGSGEEEKPSCRGGEQRGRCTLRHHEDASSLSPLLGTRCFLLAGRWGCWQEGLFETQRTWFTSPFPLVINYVPDLGRDTILKWRKDPFRVTVRLK